MTLLILVLIGAIFIRMSRSITFTWMLAWPGTVIHELLHAVIGFFLLAQPTNFSVWPERDGDQMVLGSVGFCNLAWYNRLPVAMAPLLAIPIVFVATNMFVFSATVTGFVTVWILASMLSQSLPSGHDWNVGFSSPTGIAAWAGVAYLLIR
jgi:hypothetical protein